MSVSFYIAPYPPETWAQTDYSYTQPFGDFVLEVDRYRDALLLQWPDTRLRTLVNEQYVLEWNLPPTRPNFAGLPGRLSANRQIITFGSGPKESFLAFILWDRRFVALEHELWLFSSVSAGSLRLNPDISAQEVVEFTDILD
jgi:hypothetical protein